VEELKHLLERSLSGDLEAFGEIISRFQDMAYGAAYAILGDFHLAEDAAQEAFITAYMELGKLRDLERFPGWLRRIVISQCNRLTRRRREPTVPLEAATPVPFISPEPLEAVEKKEIKDKVLEAIRSLSKPNRMATTLFYINGYSHKEIADFLEIPIGTVKRRLYDSRKKLKERMIAMVEDELKGARPGAEFREKIMRKVSRVEVRPERTEDEFGLVLLIDEADRCLMICIGQTEETAIGLALRGIKTIRPLTYELFVKVLDSFDIAVKEARVTDLRENTFYGELVMERAGEVKVIGSRPSDAIALAMMTGAKVTVAEQVMAGAHIRNEDGTPMKPKGVWEELKRRSAKMKPEKEKLARRSVRVCAGLADLPDESFKKVLAKVGFGKVLLAFTFAEANPTASKLRKKIIGRIDRTKAEKKPFRMRLIDPLISSDEVIKAQDEIKETIEELQN